jgi:glycosyltransferase involved in cell wall biosynthesis
MRILTVLTYYRPHYSGLTIYAERLGRALAQRGHHVTVLTSRYDTNLPEREALDGVEIVRLKVGMHVSKGVIMPSMPLWAWRLARQADILHLHVPQLDAAPLALLAKLAGKPAVLTYHCDLQLPPGFVHTLANQVSHLANHVSARASAVIVTNTLDYALSSPFLKRYLSKVRLIFPPVELPAVSREDVQAFRRKAGIQEGQRVIGMAARLAAEKGVEYLVQAMPAVLQKHPAARVVFVGQYQDVFGEKEYAQRLAAPIRELGAHWKFMGILPPHEFAAFFHAAEVTVLPSINSTESFGMVQVESMSCGTPVVTSDMPGVRQPVLLTGMGKIVPPRDAAALAQALIDILDHPAQYRGDSQLIAQRLSPQAVATEYEALFAELLPALLPNQPDAEKIAGQQ